jgi:trimeric autotransporter adhesin
MSVVQVLSACFEDLFSPFRQNPGGAWLRHSLWIALAATLLVTMGGAQNISAQTAPDISALPASAQARMSADIGQNEPAYHFVALARGFRTKSLRHSLSAEFTLTGIDFQQEASHWKMALKGYGYGDRLLSTNPVSPHADANRVEYRRGAFTEWYVNGPLGIEQGFTLARALRKVTDGPLTLTFTLEGDLSASLDPGARGLTLRRNGTAVLHYGGLIATDSRGRELPAWLEVAENQLRLRVDDGGAEYPLTIDPFTQAVKLNNNGRCTLGGACDLGQAQDAFGSSVSVSGDGNTVVVGAIGVQVNGTNLSGAAYVFLKPGRSGWGGCIVAGCYNHAAKLVASNPQYLGRFGKSVAISADGNTIVVGNPVFWDSSTPGTAYVFVKPSTGWASSSPLTQNARLTAFNGATTGNENELGDAVGIGADGSIVVAGASTTTINGNVFQGAAYVFARPSNGWTDGTETNRLSAGQAYGYFGDSVSIGSDGNTIAAGAPDLSGAGSVGAAYVYRPCGSWACAIQFARLTASDGPTNYQAFGGSVVISGDGNSIAVGASTCAHSGCGYGNGSGAVYVFVAPANGWATSTETAKLTASDGKAGDRLGSSLGITSDGSAITAGALGATVGSNTVQGAEYFFARPTSGWSNATETGKLSASDGAAGDEFGSSTAVNSAGTVIVVGAPNATIGSNTAQGAAYVFTGSAFFPTASVSPPSLTFGSQVFGSTSSAQTVTVTNTGTAPLVVTSVDVTAQFTSTKNCVAASPIAVGGNCSENVAFAPSSTGAISGSLTFTDNSGGIAGTTQQVQLNGTGTTATSATALASNVNPSYVNQNVTFTASVTSQYGGAVTGTITFKQGTTTLSAVPLVSGQASYSKTYTAAGSFSITAVYSGDSNNLGSTSAAVKQLVKAMATLAPSSATYAPQQVGVASVAKTITLRNFSSSPINITNAKFTGTNASDFARTGGTCPYPSGSLGPTTTCTYLITFTPSSNTLESATFTVTTDVAGSPAATLNGPGTIVKVSPTSENFGNVTVGTTSLPKTVTMKNLSATQDLTINSISISGPQGSDFAVDPASTCPTVGGVLLHSTSCTVVLKATPSALGTRKATLVFSDIDGGSPQKVSLTVTGI